MKRIQVQVNGMWFEDEKIYISDKKSNGLFVLDLRTGNCNHIGRFMAEKKNGNYLYYKIVKHDTKLYFIPDAASSIGMYDLINHEISNISLPWNAEYGEAGYNNGIIRHNELYLMPWKKGAIVKMDLGLNKFETLTYDKCLFSMISDSIIVNGSIYAVSKVLNGIIHIDEKDKVDVIIMDEREQGYSSIVYYDDNLILIPDNENDFIIYNLSMKKNQPLSNDYGKISNPYSYAFVVDENIVVLPNRAEYPLKINIRTNRISIYNELAKYFDYENKYGTAISTDNRLFFYQTNREYLVEIDYDKNEVGKQYFVVCDDVDESYYYDEAAINCENLNFELSDFLEVLKNAE